LYVGYPVLRVPTHRSEDEGMDMVEDRPSKERANVEDIDMVEDMTAEVDVVEREYECVVLMRH
jgi:hypothetical protein